MTTFVYRGVNEDGKTVGGANKFSNIEKMKIYVSTLKLKEVEIFESATTFKSINKRQLSRQEMAIFCKKMSILFNADYSFIDSIKIVSEKVRSKELRRALAEIHGFMLNGKTFVEAVIMYQHIFGKYFVSLIGACDITETFGIAFEELYEYYEKEHYFHRKLKQILIYPLSLIVMVTAIIITFNLKLMPIFYELLPRETNKNLLEIINNTAIALDNYITYFFSFVTVMIVGFIVYFKTKKGKETIDFFVTKIPGYNNVYKYVESYKFAKALSLMMKYGMPLSVAYSQSIVTIENSYNKKELEKAFVDIQRGQSFADSLAEAGIFPKVYINLIAVGEEARTLSTVFEKVAKNLEEDLDYSINRFASFIEPIVSFALLLIVLIIFLNVLLPVLNIVKLL